MLPPLSHHLAEAGSQYLDDGRRRLRLPALERLSPGHGPRLRGVHDRAGSLRRFQHLQRLADHPHLLGRIVGPAQRVAEGELDGQRARHADSFRPEGHICHQDRGKAGGLQRPCQHGHVDGAVWSGGGEQHAAHLLGFEPLSHLGTVGLPPGDRVRREPLVAHEGVSVFRQATYAPLDGQLLEAADRQQDVDVQQHRLRVDMQVTGLPLPAGCRWAGCGKWDLPTSAPASPAPGQRVARRTGGTARPTSPARTCSLIKSVATMSRGWGVLAGGRSSGRTQR